MKINSALSDEALLKQIGARLAAVRLAANLTQGQLAEQAGLGLRTVQRLELGVAATQLSGFLRICRVLGLLDRLEVLLPEAGPSPMEQLERAGQRRRRATGRRRAPDGNGAWTWGEPA